MNDWTIALLATCVIPALLTIANKFGDLLTLMGY